MNNKKNEEREGTRMEKGCNCRPIAIIERLPARPSLYDAFYALVLFLMYTYIQPEESSTIAMRPTRGNRLRV